jgi:hypothetical protein
MLQGLQPPQIAGRGNIYTANANVTSMAAYTATAGVGGPLLWNGSNANGAKGVTAYLLAVSYGLTVASTVAAAIGIIGNASQPSAPTSTTAIDGVDNLNYGSAQAPSCTAYRIGTVAVASPSLFVTGHVHTGAITVDTDDDNFVHLGGAIIIPPGCWVALGASATLTSAVITCGMTWLEVAND